MASLVFIPNQVLNTAALPAMKPLTLRRTDRPSMANAKAVKIFFIFPLKSSTSKHFMNCFPPLFSESSAIIRCISRFMA